MNATATSSDRAATVAFSIAVVTGGVAISLLRHAGADRDAVWLGAAASAVLLLSLTPSLTPSLSRRGATSPRTYVLTSAVGLAALIGVALVSGPAPAVPYAAAAVPVSVLAAVGEEALFRRVLYGLLEPRGAARAIVVSAAVFGLLHVPAYGWEALPLDAAMGVLFGWQRWSSGTWLAPAGTHSVANVFAVMA